MCEHKLSFICHIQLKVLNKNNTNNNFVLKHLKTVFVQHLLEKFSVTGQQIFPVDKDHGHLSILHSA